MTGGALFRRILENLYVQHVLAGIVFSTVLCVWFEFPTDLFWVLVLIWPLFVGLWMYAFINGTLAGMNL